MNQTATNPLRAVIFDLDDTLYDHLYSARHGLDSLSQRYPALQSVPIRELENRYSEALESIHVQLLHGEVTQTEARTRRMRQLFGSFDIHVDDATALDEYRQFRQDYDAVCQVVPGTHELLNRLKDSGLRLAVITNNLVSEQIPKLQQLGLTDFFEVVSISEEVGVPKPDPQIFAVTLQRLGLAVGEVVMVGDSLSSDIAGAVGFGMRSVWLQRRPDTAAVAPTEVATLVEDFSDLETSYAAITSSAPS